jgi:hypothetical protein
MRPDRIDREEAVLVDIMSCDDDPDLQDIHLSGKTVDVSESGMKVTMSVKVPAKTHLGLRLDLNSDVFRLEGEVRWTRNEGEMMVGVLIDKDSPDYQKWIQMFEIESE